MNLISRHKMSKYHQLQYTDLLQLFEESTCVSEDDEEEVNLCSVVATVGNLKACQEVKAMANKQSYLIRQSILSKNFNNYLYFTHIVVRNIVILHSMSSFS